MAWQAHFQEFFQTLTQVRNTTDFFNKYTNWRKWDTASTYGDMWVFTPNKPSLGGNFCGNILPPAPGGITGAVSKSNGGVVPPVNENDQYRWTAVADFYPTANPSAGAHMAIFLRVRPGVAQHIESRFGCAVQDYSQANANCPLGHAAFFEAKDESTNPAKLFCFTLLNGENPFLNPNTQYRVQVEEERVLLNISPPTFIRRWTAIVVRIDRNPDGSLNPVAIGSRTVDEVELQNNGVSIPPLAGSEIAFGFGPGAGGQMDVDQVGTALWV